MPELRSIQVGMPTDYSADAISEQPWRSGIYKSAVTGRIWLHKDGLPGDGQANLKVHGGPFRAVLVYAAVHYPVWQIELANPDLPFGAFGENLTVTELTEETVNLGDVYKVGDALIEVAQPRQPCYKLARRWEIKDLTARVERKGWGGWYCRVLQPGYIQAGDALELQKRPYPEYSVYLVDSLMTGKIENARVALALSRIEALTDTWREKFAEMGATEA
ncbi:MAG: MOSC domain-containing protein [Anaerolineaceae bacterium]|nr:MOSC domain-containing protein [Anaerolineaceae bacterium]